ncbi:MAG: hypothetical protein ABIJ34_05710 [archaeon]
MNQDNLLRLTDTAYIDRKVIFHIGDLIPLLKGDAGHKNLEFGALLISKTDKKSFDIDTGKRSLLTGGPLIYSYPIVPNLEQSVRFSGYLLIEQENRWDLTTFDQPGLVHIYETLPDFGCYIPGYTHQHWMTEWVPSSSGQDRTVQKSFVNLHITNQVSMQPIDVGKDYLLKEPTRQITENAVVYNGHIVTIKGVEQPTIFYSYMLYLITSAQTPITEKKDNIETVTNYRIGMRWAEFDPFSKDLNSRTEVFQRNLKLCIYDDPNPIVLAPDMIISAIEHGCRWRK